VCIFTIIEKKKKKIALIYLIDNTNEMIKIIDRELVDRELIERKAMPEEIYDKYSISFNLRRVTNVNEYMFTMLVAEEINFGSLLWNIQTEEISIELLTKPIFIINGREWDWELLK
jgi:hypothetical protein